MEQDKAVSYIHELIDLLLQKNGSAIFITAGSAPGIKIGNEIQRVGEKKLTPPQTEMLTQSILTERQAHIFQTRNEVNFVLNYLQTARFHVNVFIQRGSASMVLRLIESMIPPLEELSLSPLLVDLAMAQRGLILFYGESESGKSTTIASMLDYRNRHSAEHIITIEEPIEFFHQHKGCIVNQREIGVDSESYSMALSSALRQVPDVLYIGEIRDRETLEYALTFAENGRLCISTVRALNYEQVLMRLTHYFPEDRRAQFFLDFAANLRALISQRLVERSDGHGLIPAMALLINTPVITELLADGKIHEMKSILERSHDPALRTIDQSIFQLYEDGLISYETAVRRADSFNNMRLRIRLRSKRPLPAAAEAEGDFEIQGQEEEHNQWL